MTGSWIPDTYLLLGQEGLTKYNLDDTRYLKLDDRLMITNNAIHPQCWRLSKIDEKEPEGLLKLTFKRDPFDDSRDNPELRLCDYYTSTKDIKIDPIEIDKEFPDMSKEFNIFWAVIGEDGILVKDKDNKEHYLKLSSLSYFIAEIPRLNEEKVKLNWTLEVIPEESGSVSVEDEKYLTGLLDIQYIDDCSISIKPAKAQSLVGKKFKLIAQDKYNTYKSEIELEVS